MHSAASEAIQAWPAGHFRHEKATVQEKCLSTMTLLYTLHIHTVAVLAKQTLVTNTTCIRTFAWRRIYTHCIIHKIM